MKIELGGTQSSFVINFDYPNLTPNTNVSFIWNFNTNIFNEENRLWNFLPTDSFYLLVRSQYTHKEFKFMGSVLFTNDRYTSASFLLLQQNDPQFIPTQDEGFYYFYYCLEELGGDIVVIYEDLTYISFPSKKTTFTPAISSNETREIIFAD